MMNGQGKYGSLKAFQLWMSPSQFIPVQYNAMYYTQYCTSLQYIKPRMDLAGGSTGPTQHQHYGGDQGNRRGGWLIIYKQYFYRKPNRLLFVYM